MTVQVAPRSFCRVKINAGTEDPPKSGAAGQASNGYTPAAPEHGCRAVPPD